MTETVIGSHTILTDFDHHFRVLAGPGAGKTYWLVNHVRNVIRKSRRISPSSYVACISYTNVAVNEIMRGLGRSAERADVSTIHSFLYRNIVRPYVHLLIDESGKPLVNHALLDGHDEHRPTIPAVRGWLESVSSRMNFFANLHEIFAYLKSLTWQRDDTSATWSLKPLGRVPPVKYLPTSKLGSYKSFYWREGVIDHDDVLYFAYRLLEEYPRILEFLSMRFPYLFIDEFQDTNPIQTQVVKWLAGHNTFVGVIGDFEQSIYGFNGAKPEDFKKFSLPGHTDYIIRDNWRSTDSIIRILNHVRGDNVRQKGLRQVSGEPVRTYVGEVETSISLLKRQLSPGEQLVVLARRNDEASRLRRLISTSIDDLWDQLSRIDADRCHFLEHLISASELAILHQYSLALTKLLRGIRVSKGLLKKPFKLGRTTTHLECRGLAVSLLHYLVDSYSQFRQSHVLDVYQQVSNHLSKTIDGLSLTTVKPGRFCEFAASTTCEMLADALRLQDETRCTRTIHQAKSAEFGNVLVCLGKKAQLDHILQPIKKRSDKEAEERRIIYVALSRARDRLFISIPELLEGDEKRLEELGFEVVHAD